MDGFTVSALDFLGTVFQCEDYIGRRGLWVYHQPVWDLLSPLAKACQKKERQRERI